MKFRLFGMLIASAGALALAVAVNEASATPRGVTHTGVAPVQPHRLTTPFFRHRHRPQEAIVWPSDDSFAQMPYPETGMDVPPMSGAPGVRHTDEIPWDWVHRYPPSTAQFDKPHAPGCANETVTVPDGRGGKGEVNVTRCY